MRQSKLRKKVVAGPAAAALICTGALLSSPATAVAGHAPATFTADPLATWQTDGIVWSLAYARGVVYAAGSFDTVRPPGAAPGTRQVRRHNFAAFDAATGKLLPCALSFTSGAGPYTAGTVRAMKPSPDGRVLYVGGSFGHAGSTGVANAVAVDTADCTLRKDFRPAVNATVRAIETTDRGVYLGGDFNQVGGQSRNRIAAFTPGGSLLPFKADIDLPVRALSAVPARREILVGGDFESVNGRPAHALAALDITSGATVHTYPGWLPAASVVKSFAQDGSHFYIGAEGTGHRVFDGRISARLRDNKMVWKDTCLGATQAVLPYKGVLYSASHAHDCWGTPGGFPERGLRHTLLAQSVTDRRILHWFPDTDGGLGEGVGPRALTMARGTLWVGGEFTRVNDRPQQGLTRFGTGTPTSLPQTPALTLLAAIPGKVTIGWRASWDRTTAALAYRLYRDGKPVSRQTLSSTPWNLPQMSYTDSVPAGTRHRYAIEVTVTGTRTSHRSPSLSVTVPARTGPSPTTGG
ncbi:fibronectin type III domain-containing protein [Streptomyces sp. NPDC004232]|uniref:fibronectin type III domain-containing protein n=1 Tax=Streptomyces sp. NPDC004232 TaxID=3154454 RepID=UPI0033B3C3CD